MDTPNNTNHPATLFILVLIVIAISVLGYSTLKNANNSVSSIAYITPAPSPQPTKKPEPSIIRESTVSAQTFFPTEAGMTLEETQQQKPGPPSGLTIIQVPDGLQLQWKAIRGDVISYTIYRSDEKSAFKKISTVNAEDSLEKNRGTYEFIDLSVIFDTNYTYAVTVTNIFRNESNQSEPVLVHYVTLNPE